VRRIGVIVLLLLLAGAAQPTALAQSQSQDILDSSLVVRFLDAGDGDAVWITTPSPDRALRLTVLVDCGPPAFGGRLALQLQASKVPQIDTLLLSGASDDLIGGCADLLQQIPIREIRWTGQRSTTPTWAALEALLSGQGWSPLGLSAGDTMAWGDVQGTVLNPPQGSDPTLDPDNTLVLEIDYAKWGILLAGNIHERGERQTGSWLGIRSTPIQVLKVADHGSAAGSSLPFLSAVFNASAPLVSRTAVVTNGRSTFSPRIDRSVVDNLSAMKAEVVNTAAHGTITVVVQPLTGPRYVAER